MTERAGSVLNVTPYPAIEGEDIPHAFFEGRSQFTSALYVEQMY